MVLNRVWFSRETRNRRYMYLSFQLQMNNRGREVTKIYHISCILPSLDFGTDAKLNYATTKLVGKFVTTMSGLKTDMATSENGCGKWYVLV